MINNTAIIILSTVPSNAKGERIADKLVEAGFAACVQILPRMTSVYRWEGKIQKDYEFIIIIKSTKEREVEVYQLIHDLHSYNVPEILTIPIQNGDESYLKWLQSCTKFKQ